MPKWFKTLIIVLIAIAAVIAIIFGITVAAGIKLYNDAQDLTEEMDKTLNELTENMEQYTGANNTVEDSVEQMNALYITMFNDQFMMFAGENVRGSSVKSLIKVVQTNNETSEDKVTLSGITTADEIENSAKYTVKESYAKNGMINKITITKN